MAVKQTFLGTDLEEVDVSALNPMPTTGSLTSLTTSSFRDISLVMVSRLDDIILQLKLLNMRIEEGFETHTNEEDL